MAPRPPPRAIAGVPILLEDTWASIAQAVVGGAGRYAAKTWSQMLDEDFAVDGRIVFVETSARRAVTSYRKIDHQVRARGISVLPFEQRALIAMQELARRRAERPQ